MKTLAIIAAILLYVAGSAYIISTTKGATMDYAIEMNGVKLQRTYPSLNAALQVVDTSKLQRNTVCVINQRTQERIEVKGNAAPSPAPVVCHEHDR